MKGLFITSVGTEIGKTLVTTLLCRQLIAKGRRVTALKPVVSGYSEDDPQSDPARILRALGQSPTAEAVAAIAPWRFAEPVSPHLAARREGRTVALDEVVVFSRRAEKADVRLVEGAGGIMSPIVAGATCLDLAAALGDPAVLVTGTHLGAISHTLTAIVALRSRGVGLAGIVVSESETSAGFEDMMDSVREFAAEAPIIPLPRIKGDVEAAWRAAADLTAMVDDSLVERSLDRGERGA